MIRSLVEYRRFISFFVIILFFLAPFAIYELYYSHMPIADFFRGSFDVIKKNVEYRFDLSRVQVVFPHSILFGLFCSLPIASIFYLYRDRIAKLIIYLSLSVCMTLMSLSSAPLISVFLQVGMISWGIVTKDRWRLLVGILLFLYLVAEIFSNRGAVIIFIETFTIDPQTGWWRVYIWRYGSAAVMQHPILGIGLDIYDKPDWLTASVDNFWLLTALRHGLVGLFLLALVFILHIWHILRAENLTAETKMARKGYMITLICVIFSLTTVHVWGVLHVVVMFFLGSGSFFYTSNAETREPDETSTVFLPTVGRNALPLTRFSQRPKLSKHPRRQSSAWKQPETH